MLTTRLISRLKRIDWDFAGTYSESAYSTLHWHPARFASQLPASILGLLSERGQTVLDPFMGSGTTIVEAQRLGRIAIGVDVNPISCLIVEAKTLRLRARTIARLIENLIAEANMVRSAKRTRPALTPKGVQGEKWYTKKTLMDLSDLWTLIQGYEGPLKKLASAAFSASLMPSCREDRHWGYICDNSTPKSDKAIDVIGHYTGVLGRFRDAYAERDQWMHEVGIDKLERVKVFCGDARRALRTLGGETVDLVVTSPPYFGVSDYVKSQRLSMEWFGLEIEPVRLAEIGARSKRHRKTAAEEYVTDVTVVFEETYRILKPGGACVIVVGESGARPEMLSGLKVALGKIGFSLELDIDRRVSHQRRQAPSIVGERVFVLSR